MTFNAQDIASQKGKTIIVTGANAGLGYETVLALATKGAKVIMACRSQQRAEEAMLSITEAVPDADLSYLQLDLTHLKSVRSFVKQFSAKHKTLDVLINNAGVMIPPYSKTKDGFELQMGANYFGHFLLTGLLLDKLQATPNSRVVSLSSLAHLNAGIHFSDLHWEKSYSKMRAYQQSKLACLMFALELQARFEKAGSNTISVAAHPGISTTELSRHIPKLLYFAFLPAVSLVSHPPHKGVLPTLMAATDESIAGGDYIGPTGFKEMSGEPGKARIARRAKNKEVSAKLWSISEELTGFKYSI